MLIDILIKRTKRIPALELSKLSDKARTLTRQLDAALLTVGFKLSPELVEHLNRVPLEALRVHSRSIIGAVNEMVGAHVEHNAYFIDFPFNVPDTEDFWTDCLRDAIEQRGLKAIVQSIMVHGGLNLLDLPKYGKYQHTYEQLQAEMEELIPKVGDRLTILSIGGSIEEETVRLYKSLLFSAVPLNDADKEILRRLFGERVCAKLKIKDKIPVRENKAIVNACLVARGSPPIQIDTYTDILRIAAALSGSDVTLATAPRFKSFKRSVRTVLMQAIDAVDFDKVSDVLRHREQWKRLGERLHPHEYDCGIALKVFAVARGERKARTLNSLVESAFVVGEPALALSHMRNAPGVLFRNIDRTARYIGDASKLVNTVALVAGDVSGRVLLSVMEHLANRSEHGALKRLFTNSKGKAWVIDETRPPLDVSLVNELTEVIRKELSNRLPTYKELRVDDAMMNYVALPLSEKNKVAGLNIMPRGSIFPIDSSGSLRFFMYWHQTEERTDYDLSLITLDQNFNIASQVSWTNLRSGNSDGRAIVHSGDITSAENGASEFIDAPLRYVEGSYLVPQVNQYAGESFAKCKEAFFGYMTRGLDQKGMPFEPKTVQMKSDLRSPKEDAGKIALPLVFIKTGEGWSAKWMHLHLKGLRWRNSTETNKMSTSIMVRGIVERRYLKVGDLLRMMRHDKKGQSISASVNRTKFGDKWKHYDLTNLHELIPE